VEDGLRRAGVSGHEPSLGRRREVVLDERPLLRRRLRVKADEAGDKSASDDRWSRHEHAGVNKKPEPTSTIGSGCVN
jgi:hypothetical protein